MSLSDHDLKSELLRLSLQVSNTPGFGLGCELEDLIVIVGRLFGHQMVDDPRDAVRRCRDSLRFAQPRLHFAAPVSQVAFALPQRLRTQAQRSGQPVGYLPRPARQYFAPALSVVRTQPQPRGKVLLALKLPQQRARGAVRQEEDKLLNGMNPEGSSPPRDPHHLSSRRPHGHADHQDAFNLTSVNTASAAAPVEHPKLLSLSIMQRMYSTAH